jgi:hypothetical protein
MSQTARLEGDDNVWSAAATSNVNAAAAAAAADTLGLESSPIVGLDFGTSNSCVSIWDTTYSRCKTVRIGGGGSGEDGGGERITPSTVTYLGGVADGRVAIGLADAAASVHTVCGVKSHLAEGHAAEGGAAGGAGTGSSAGTSAGAGSSGSGSKGVLCVYESGERRVASPEEVGAWPCSAIYAICYAICTILLPYYYIC